MRPGLYDAVHSDPKVAAWWPAKRVFLATNREFYGAFQMSCEQPNIDAERLSVVSDHRTEYHFFPVAGGVL